MTLHYENLAPLHVATAPSDWLHEGIGKILPTPDARGIDLACLDSKQGAQGCMAFFKSPLPDHIAISYELTVHSQRGLVINYLALRGLAGENPFDPASQLPPRTGIMANYWASEFGLQSYHLSFSRYNDKGIHTGTANIRRNPGGYLVGHGIDPVRLTGTPFHVRITKDLGAIQLFINDQLAIASVDHATNMGPIPDQGYFGFRLVGSDVRITIKDFAVHTIAPASLWSPWLFKP
jgi:hypothetical protein